MNKDIINKMIFDTLATNVTETPEHAARLEKMGYTIAPCYTFESGRVLPLTRYAVNGCYIDRHEKIDIFHHAGGRKMVVTLDKIAKIDFVNYLATRNERNLRRRAAASHGNIWQVRVTERDEDGKTHSYRSYNDAYSTLAYNLARIEVLERHTDRCEAEARRACDNATKDCNELMRNVMELRALIDDIREENAGILGRNA